MSERTLVGWLLIAAICVVAVGVVCYVVGYDRGAQDVKGGGKRKEGKGAGIGVMSSWATTMTKAPTGEELNRGCEEVYFDCSNCGDVFLIMRENEDGDVWCDEAPRFCPTCGAPVGKVVRFSYGMRGGQNGLDEKAALPAV